jgi:hypothetical protein
MANFEIILYKALSAYQRAISRRWIMRQRLGTVLAVVVALLIGVAPARGADDDKARGIIHKAIKAKGGAEKLGKLKASTWKEEGTYYGMGDGLPYKGTYAAVLPDKFRMDIENVFTIVFDGDKGWSKMSGGEAKAMNKEELSYHQQQQRGTLIATLVPLKDKAFTLEDLGETKVDKKPAVGVKVTRKGYPETKLYFDKKSNMLIKTISRTKSPEQKFKEVVQEVSYQDYKPVNGVQLPHKIVVKRGGKVYVDATFEDWKLKEKLDAKTFAKP